MIICMLIAAAIHQFGYWQGRRHERGGHLCVTQRELREFERRLDGSRRRL